MDSGWDDTPTNMQQTRMDEGWDTAPLNLEQPCPEEVPLNSSNTNPVVSNEPVPSAPVASAPLNSIEASTTVSCTISSNIPPSEPIPSYTSSNFSHPPAPPSYEESQRQD